MTTTFTRRMLLMLALLWLLPTATASAHVKWFTPFSFGDDPHSLPEVVTARFIVLLVITAGVAGVLAVIERQINDGRWYRLIVRWLDTRRGHSFAILRIGAAMTLLLSWQADTLLAPELAIPAAWVGWLQFVMVLLLMFEVTVPLVGVGYLLLISIGVAEFGLFHVLDYALYLGLAYYFISRRLPEGLPRALGLPALYASLGFSLMWVAFEKLVYPQWGLQVLADNPDLTLGIQPELFLQMTAFIELILGFLLIIGLLERPLSLAVTATFFTTTLIFGKTEVIGHTIIHATLIVFLLEGAGVVKAPIDIHRRVWLRLAFASVNLVIITLLLLAIYSFSADRQFDTFDDQTAQVIP